ncbi:MAG: menaquinone biosynthesis protein [Nitrospirota bacterium]|nr:MAG: menaquinone biosynthesis protein [Nitrospirota bacterium]
MKLKIGKIRFLNLYPIFYTLEKECDPELYEFVEGTPSALNAMIREGTVDVSPSSSIEYLRNPDKYTMIEGHSISSTDCIKSILLFSKRPVDKLGGARVLATDQSETSVALLKIILKDFFSLEADIVVADAPLKEGLRDGEAYMMIGDDALKAVRSDIVLDKKNRILTYDLGKIWYERTGHPFVFALWIARKDCCKLDRFQLLIEHLDMARDFAKLNLDEIAEAASKGSFMKKKELVDYWETISYDMNEYHKEGLKLFRKYLADAGDL